MRIPGVYTCLFCVKFYVLVSPAAIIGFGLFDNKKLAFVTGDSPFERCGKLYSGCSQARLNDNFTTSMF